MKNYTRKFFKIIFFSVVFALLIPSCKKHVECCTFPKEVVSLRWDGEPALDGCGFVFVFPDASEKKVTDDDVIDSSFKTNSPTTVEIEFSLTGEVLVRCFAPANFEGIELISLERK